MNKIKFRIWDKSTKHMIDWNALCDKDQVLKLCDVLDGIYDNLSAMQFIGAQDANGKDIYEGDIVRLSDDTISKYGFDDLNQSDITGVVVFNQEETRFDIEGLHDWYYRIYEFYHVEWSEVEVLGNIYENSELLKD